ncbi:MAG TPA: SpoIIE family protein phosphatase, partial [Acidobacteriota bacterium]|nr:SpoIIE family protein phosphatase [Acidobacteriota bacterium]
ARENDLIIPSESLSRFHAQINHRKSGDFSVTDRGSLNGVYVNGTRIYSETMLKDGDIIGFGDHHVRFCIEETKPLVEKEKSSEKIQRFSFTSLVDSQRFEPEKRQRYLELLYQFSARLLQQFPSSDLGNVALDLVQEVWSPDRACLMMHSESNEWQIINQRFGKNPELTGDSLQISSSVIRELESNEEALLIPNRLEDDRFRTSESMQRQNVNSVICAPLWNNKKIHGFLYADLLMTVRSFGYGDLEMFAILANLIAIKWENDQLWHKTLLQQQLEQELNLAGEIQRKFFPLHPPAIEGYDLAAISIPSRKVGGDAYFWHERSDGGLVLMIADVMGKGLPSALLMSQIQAIMKIFAEQYSEPRDIVNAVNQFIYQYSSQDKFISMVVVHLYPPEGKLLFCNAGHNPPFLLKPNGSYQLLELGGMPVGMFPDQSYQQGSAHITDGETLVFYTDGIVEARNDADEEFGFERVVDLVREQGVSEPLQTIENVVRYIREQWLATDQEDDWTLLVMMCGPEDPQR